MENVERYYLLVFHAHHHCPHGVVIVKARHHIFAITIAMVEGLHPGGPTSAIELPTREESRAGAELVDTLVKTFGVGQPASAEAVLKMTESLTHPPTPQTAN